MDFHSVAQGDSFVAVHEEMQQCAESNQWKQNCWDLRACSTERCMVMVSEVVVMSAAMAETNAVVVVTYAGGIAAFFGDLKTEEGRSSLAHIQSMWVAQVELVALTV